MQYSFIYQALLEHYLYGDTELDVSSLEGHLHRLHSTHIHMDRVGLEEEFRVMCFSYCFSARDEFDPSLRCSDLGSDGRHCMLCQCLCDLCFLLLQKLTNVRIMKENMRTGNLSANMRKNRVLQIIPCKEMILHHSS